MSMYDWNHDGNNDWQDDFIEYQIYKDVMGESDEPSYTPRRGNGMSTFGAIISVVAGLVGQCLLYMMLGIDVENVPVIVMIVLWVVISAVAAVVVEMMGL